MGKLEYQKFLNTDYWKEVARKVKEAADWRCQICNSREQLEAHHRTYEHHGNELEHLGDLICLCRKCHQRFHDGRTIHRDAPPNKRKRKPGGVHYPAPGSLVEIDPAKIMSEMPPGSCSVFLDNKHIRKVTRGGMLTRASAIALGLKYPLVHGWQRKLRGTFVSRETYQAALEGKYLSAGCIKTVGGVKVDHIGAPRPLPKWGAGVARAKKAAHQIGLS